MRCVSVMEANSSRVQQPVTGVLVCVCMCGVLRGYNEALHSDFFDEVVFCCLIISISAPI